jgi:transposase
MTTAAQRLVERSRIVLRSAGGQANASQAYELDVDRQRVRRWRVRWAGATEVLAAAEAKGASENDLEKLIIEVLSDDERSGAPPHFMPEQVVDIIALACEPPGDSGLPVSHWTPKELAREAIKRGIVKSISPRHLDRILSEAELRPHKSRYWLTSKDKREAPAEYQENVEKICEIYRDAPKLAAAGTHVKSVDEKAGIQALERLHKTKPVRPGLEERVEFEYRRHGTQTLIANFDVVTGKVVSPSIGQTRTEEDYVAHIAKTIDTDPAAGWVFVNDQLDTHKSAKLVELVAQRCGIKDDLGVKGKKGILKSKKSRRTFLEDHSHRIRLVYTPRHCSWLNQVEIWFSILARRLLRRSSFTSVENLRARVLEFIEYFNSVLAKPFRWTYTGRPLQA